ncbi:MAG: hypothetical protein H7Z43_14795, partial [Clostridia bacterium]|nr:hypothetical protein [Deltaproteobacteria bacterium]
MCKITVLALLGLAACGAGSDEGSSNATPSTDESDGTSSTTFSSDDQTPGIYRDTYRLLDAVAAEGDNTTAVDRMYADLTNKLQNTASFDALAEDEEEAVKGLYLLALRSVQATHHHPDVARDIGETILKRVLELDRARSAWNTNHDAKDHVKFSAANAALIADATEATL